MLVVCDFDGTVTARDTNTHLAKRFAPDAYEHVEGKLASRELSLRDVLGAEYAAMDASLPAVVDAALEIPFRPGFAEFLDAAAAGGATVVLLSSGFRQVIEPMLDRAGLLGRVPLVANDVAFGERGGAITWRDLPHCELCGEQCKRHDVAELRRRHAAPGETVVFIGDGFSDRCGAESADVVFARDSLARYLDDAGHPYQGWGDFHDVTAALRLGAPSGG